jgi:hypothetical protein
MPTVPPSFLPLTCHLRLPARCRRRLRRRGPLCLGGAEGVGDDMVISLYAHGMSVRDILHHLEQVYGTQLPHETVSRITGQVLEEVRAWQSRPLDPVWAVAFLDAIMVKVRGSHVVQPKPAYLAVGADADGESTCCAWWRPDRRLEGRHNQRLSRKVRSWSGGL